MSTGMLFDKSPPEGDGQAKKKSRRSSPKPAAAKPAASTGIIVEHEASEHGYLLSLDDVPCDQCGAPADLVEVVSINGRRRWRVMCGWWCLHSWMIDPIPGLLETIDKKENRTFVLREGRYPGKTFDEIDDAGGRWYIEQLAGGRTRSQRVKEEATEWLRGKGVDTESGHANL